MPEMRGDRFVGEETVRITIVGALAIAAVIIAFVLLIGYLSRTSSQGPEQSHA
jgi:hypothetical protein